MPDSGGLEERCGFGVTPGDCSLAPLDQDLPLSPLPPIVERGQGQLGVLAKLAHVKHSSGPFPAGAVWPMHYGERQIEEKKHSFFFF